MENNIDVNVDNIGEYDWSSLVIGTVTLGLLVGTAYFMYNRGKASSCITLMDE